MIEYIRSFILASSYPVFFPHFLSVSLLDESTINYTYTQYTFIAPLYYGFMNMLSLWMSKIWNLTRRERYLWIGTISPLIVITFAFLFNSYNYTPHEWIRYVIVVFCLHFIIFNLIIYSLDRYI